MYNHGLHQRINQSIKDGGLDIGGNDNLFFARFMANTSVIFDLYMKLYEHHPKAEQYFQELVQVIIKAHIDRAATLKERDLYKSESDHWFLSNEITGMSLYVDRFCGNIKNVETQLDYFEKLGVNFLHLMPMFESPENESDGGYAVSDFRKIDKRFGVLKDLRQLQEKMQKRNMYLMIDIVLNHTSHHHPWAKKAKDGDRNYQDYYYFYNDRSLPDQYDQTMPDVFPESSPGNFTYIPECNKWVMTVFHHYQWDLNYNNPQVFVEMLDTIFFYANLGVDILRIDAPAFIGKQLGTTCQNLPQAHTILRLIKQCVQVAAPGMALLGEAIVAPKDIMGYFGNGEFTARECDFAYNATTMALQWDMLATADTRVMLAAQHELLKKPTGTSWITYTRCHDDIGLAYEDYMIQQAGFVPFEHRKFLKNYYSGNHAGSPAKGALFSSNPKTGDARISGSLASLCGLEKAVEDKDEQAIDVSIKKILLMQAHSFFIGGVPMLFYGDELGYTNDYSFLKDPGKSYDNRWMHRPVIDWEKNKKINKQGSVEQRIFSGTQKLIALRKKLSVVADHSNLTWLTPHNIHVAGFLRSSGNDKLFGIFNFNSQPSFLTWYAFKEQNIEWSYLFDHWKGKKYSIG
ncbi:MAG: alpha-amylase family protein, partial [Chitinophagaceae bacterium]